MAGNKKNNNKGKKNNNNKKSNPNKKAVTVGQVKSLINQANSTKSKNNDKKKSSNSITSAQAKQLDIALKGHTEVNQLKCAHHCIPTKELKAVTPGAGRYTNILTTSSNTAAVETIDSLNGTKSNVVYKIDISISCQGPSSQQKEITKNPIPDVVFAIASDQLKLLQTAGTKIAFVCKASEQATTATWFSFKTTNEEGSWRVTTISAAPRANITIAKPVRVKPEAIKGNLEGGPAAGTPTAQPVSDEPSTSETT